MGLAEVVVNNGLVVPLILLGNVFAFVVDLVVVKKKVGIVVVMIVVVEVVVVVVVMVVVEVVVVVVVGLAFLVITLGTCSTTKGVDLNSGKVGLNV